MYAKIKDISQEKFNTHIYGVNKRVKILLADRSVNI